MFTAARTPPHLMTLIVLTAVPILTLNMFLPALAELAAEFGIPYGTAALAVSAYMVATAMLQIIVGPMSDRYGRRPVLMISAAVFVVASIGCTFAQSFEAFMAWRVVQAAVISANALGRAIVRDVHAPRDAAAKLGVIGSVMALGPMVAPLVGGLVLAGFGWRANFVIFAAFGLALFWLIWADVGETAPKVPRTLKGQFIAFGALLSNWGFWSYAGCMALSVGVFFAYISGVPLIAQQLGASPVMAGLAMGAPPLGFMLGNIVAARYARRVALARMMIAGRLFTLCGVTVAALLWSLGAIGPLGVVLLMSSIGVGNGLTTPAASAGAMSVRPDLTGAAAGLSGAMMLLTGAAMTGVSGWVLGSAGGGIAVLLGVLLVLATAALLAGLPALRLRDEETAPA